MRQDRQKVGGTRWDLDKVCGKSNERCAKNPDGSLLRNAQGQVQWTGEEKSDGTMMGFNEFLKTPDGKELSGLTGGIQGMPGTLNGSPYAAGSWQDKLIEAFAGTHDMIGGKLPGFYDKEGNAKRGLTPAQIVAREVWAGAAILPSAPFAMAELLPPSVWNAVSTLLKGMR